MMDVFFEVKPIVRILYFLTFFATFQATVAVELIDCIKSDECSCKTNTKPQQQISLWPMPGRNGIFGGNWLYDINLCHGVDKNVNSTFGGCQNATVCQYETLNKDMTFEIGQFGNATFGQYNNETKSISLKYYGVPQSGSTRSINITLNCDENGNITHPDYREIKSQFPWDLIDFVTTIKTKAACLRPVTIPTSRSHVASSGGGGLKTVYIVLIAVSGFVVVIAIGSYVVYKINKRQNRGLINREEENQDYGTVPQVQVQNAALFTPVSGPI